MEKQRKRKSTFCILVDGLRAQTEDNLVNVLHLQDNLVYLTFIFILACFVSEKQDLLKFRCLKFHTRHVRMSQMMKALILDLHKNLRE